jgi:iron(III) transport system substrate-binding protein
MFNRLRGPLAIGSSVLLLAGLASACSSNNKTTAGGSTASATGPMTLDSVCKAGATEGSVSFWADVEPDTFKQEIASFESSYPGIKVNYTQLQPQDQVQRILAETQAGHALDVDASSPDSASSLPLFAAKAVVEVDLSQLGVNPNLATQVDGMKVFTTQRTYGGLAYNTTLVKPQDLPNTWEELANSKYAGKVSVDPRGKWLAPISIVWGKDKTITWYQNLMSQAKPQVVSGITSSLTKVISGEVPMTASGRDAEVAQMQAKNAPVAIKYLDVVQETDQLGLLLKDAKHPNAAKCFLAWKAGEGGQAAQLKHEFKGNTATPQGLPAAAKLAINGSPEDLALIADVGKQLSKLSKG